MSESNISYVHNDEEEENNEQSEIHEKSDFPVKSKDFI